VYLCWCWIAISKETICGAEKTWKAYCEVNEASTCGLFLQASLEERNVKAKAMDAEAKLLAKKRDHVNRHEHHVNKIKGLGGEETSHDLPTQGVIAHELVLLFLCPFAYNLVLW
jgi:hypothetical protein